MTKKLCTLVWLVDDDEIDDDTIHDALQQILGSFEGLHELGYNTTDIADEEYELYLAHSESGATLKEVIVETVDTDAAYTST